MVFPVEVRTRVGTRVEMRVPARRSVLAFIRGQSAHLLYTKAQVGRGAPGRLGAREFRLALDVRTLGAGRGDDQRLLHGGHVRAAQLGFDFVQLVGLSVW